ncbi:MAG TPA: DNA gyrase modulator, partial [Rhizomicrobium sp.]
MAENDLFFSRTGMDRARVQAQVDGALKGADDGELFLEYSQSESFVFDDNRLKAASFDTSQGFGLRAVVGEATGYAHATELSEDAIARAAKTVKAVAAGHSGHVAAAPARSNVKLYTDLDPLETAQFSAKVSLLEQMNQYARGKDSRVRQVSASLSGEWQRIEIMRAGGEHYSDTRPLVRLGVSVVVEQDGRQESGSFGGGGRGGYETYLETAYWKEAVDEALRQALVNLESVPAPAGEMTVVLGP